MTVESVNGDEIGCVWFHRHEPKFQAFPAATLNHYTPPTYQPMPRRKSVWD